MKDTAIIKKARDAGRAALDEENGKKLLSESGISVPKSTVVSDCLLYTSPSPRDGT